MQQAIKPEGQKAYKVLKIDELTRMSNVGGIELYYRHTVKTRGGTTFTKDIDEKDMSAEKVDTILTKKATELDKILSL